MYWLFVSLLVPSKTGYPYWQISLRARVRWGRTAGSERYCTQDNGPSDLYVSRKSDKASLRSVIISSSLRTVSGLNRPWAVEKAGSVSQLAKTESESWTEGVVLLLLLLIRRLLAVRVVTGCVWALEDDWTPGVDRIRWADMGGVCDDGDAAGTYMVMLRRAVLR